MSEFGADRIITAKSKEVWYENIIIRTSIEEEEGIITQKKVLISRGNMMNEPMESISLTQDTLEFVISNLIDSRKFLLEN